MTVKVLKQSANHPLKNTIAFSYLGQIFLDVYFVLVVLFFCTKNRFRVKYLEKNKIKYAHTGTHAQIVHAIRGEDNLVGRPCQRGAPY